MLETDRHLGKIKAHSYSVLRVLKIHFYLCAASKTDSSIDGLILFEPSLTFQLHHHIELEIREFKMY